MSIDIDEIMQINKNQIPDYLKDSELYKTFQENDDDDDDEQTIPISQQYFKQNNNIETEDDLIWYLHTIRYWMLNKEKVNYSLIFNFVFHNELLDYDFIKNTFFDLDIAQEIYFLGRFIFPKHKKKHNEDEVIPFKRSEKKYLEIFKSINKSTIGKKIDNIFEIWKREYEFIYKIIEEDYIHIQNYILYNSSCPKFIYNYLYEYVNNKETNFYNLYIVEIIKNKYMNLYNFLINKCAYVLNTYIHNTLNKIPTLIINSLIKYNCVNEFKYTLKNIFPMTNKKHYKYINSKFIYTNSILIECVKNENLEILLYLFEEYITLRISDNYFKKTIKYCFKFKKMDFMDKICTSDVITQNFKNIENIKTIYNSDSDSDSDSDDAAISDNIDSDIETI